MRDYREIDAEFSFIHDSTYVINLQLILEHIERFIGSLIVQSQGGRRLCSSNWKIIETLTSRQLKTKENFNILENMYFRRYTYGGGNVARRLLARGGKGAIRNKT